MPAQNQLAREEAARARRTHAGQDSGDVEDDGVLGEQAQSHGRADRQPPAGISDLSRRMVKYAISTHHKKSNEVYWNSVPSKRGRGESATASAAVTCARRPPPSSRGHEPG